MRSFVIRVVSIFRVNHTHIKSHLSGIVRGYVDILNKLTPYKLFKLTPIDNLCFLVGICRS